MISAGSNVMSLEIATAQPPAVLESTDEMLVAKLRSGDTHASEVLVKRYAESLLRYLQRLTKSDHLAEEMHQQTWISVLDHIGRFDENASGGFKAWLFRIATNKANDYWRSKGREKSAHESLRLVTEVVGPEASVRMEGAQDVDKLRKAIDLLPEAQKQVLMLRYYSEMKFTDIAKVLGCPLNTALGRMHKAILKLRQLME